MRNFNDWIESMTDSVADWTYYTNFPKVYNNVNEIKIPLSIMNSLIGSDNIRSDFLVLLNQYPEILKVVPILIAKRLESTIIIKDAKKDYYFNFSRGDYTNEQYADFLENTGIFHLLQKHIVSNLFDYVTGVEVGLDTNSRKNRTGHIMDNVVLKYLEAQGFVLGEDLFKKIHQTEIEKHFKVDLSAITPPNEMEKYFNYVIKANRKIYLIKTNFYSNSSSKLTEKIQIYKTMAERIKEIQNVEFVWITDGLGWMRSKKTLKDAFDILNHIYNINDLKNGYFNKLT